MKTNELQHILNCHPIMKSDIVHGNNTSLFDSQGKKIIDFESGIWCTALGHTNPRITEVLTEQAKKLIHVHYKFTSIISEQLAINLLSLFHFRNGKSVFLSSGSEAVELAIRLSRMISRKGKALVFSTSYLSAFSTQPRDKNLWCEIDYLSCNSCSSDKCSRSCPILSDIPFDEISSFVLEPATCGIVVFPPYRLVRYIAEEIRNNGGTIVANEVTTGLGRTGKWFGYNHYEIEPDIVALGKGLGNGYPISAVVMSEEVAEIIERQNFTYCQSHQNDPLGCTIANEVINIFKEDNIIEHSNNKGNYFATLLRNLQNSTSIVREVRHKGLMLALELKVDNKIDYILEEMLTLGFFIGAVPAKNVLRFSPALTIDENDISNMCNSLETVLKKLTI